MEGMRTNRDLIWWMKSFISGRRVELALDRHQCEETAVDTGVPQGLLEKVNKTVKERAERPGTRRCPERLASHAQVKCTITERKSKEAEHRFKTENDRRSCYREYGMTRRLRVRA